ncbi:MAG: XRE family transcriptional regulator [Nitrospirae bacterium]|nr:MAG: XRE family transcriptional regulator [Nitrospirota bacterium]
MRQLRLQRVLAGLSQVELARRVGKSPAWLSRVERGYLQPDPSVLSKIKDALKTGEPHMNGGVALSLAKCDCEEAVKLPWDWD